MATDSARNELDISVQAPRRYRVVYIAVERGPFFSPVRIGGEIIVQVNMRHPFFEVLYADLLRPGGEQDKEAVDLVLITLAKFEVTASPEDAQRYVRERERRWSPFLATALRSLSQRLPTSEDEGEYAAAVDAAALG